MAVGNFERRNLDEQVWWKDNYWIFFRARDGGYEMCVKDCGDWLRGNFKSEMIYGNKF